MGYIVEKQCIIAAALLTNSAGDQFHAQHAPEDTIEGYTIKLSAEILSHVHLGSSCN
jgi:hypothetical protein